MSAAAAAPAVAAIRVEGLSRLFGETLAVDDASFEIALQYLAAGDGGAGATVGAQDASASSAVEYACNGNRLLQSARSVCLFDPRFPPQAALDQVFTDGFEGTR